ncbi:hypothetical protein C8F04DRAFT_346867 [Mycena alexandri]|uniref:Cytochrome P450 n=1 Tax=Mycena alexandri TaxID=1745969 RepID=A0AAD6S8P3_9AGAR|nr:hypothetical protein C8F04DRAFT_197813 [Mycena alexandri]KAJ7038663.1 hypothetical protein C8F04DRAFT_346867 [Mycena alexandri]
MCGKAFEPIKLFNALSPLDFPVLTVWRSRTASGTSRDITGSLGMTKLVDGTASVWAHLFSFLGGPHNCIGWRGSLAEMKSLLSILIRTFEFELAVPPEGMNTLRMAVQSPVVIGEEEKGPQLPMRMRRVQT